MAVYRMIELSFWSDPKVADEFTPEDRYMYLYLMTNTHTNLAGCYEVSIRQIAIETGYCKESVENILARMEKTHQVIAYSKQTREVLLRNWYKHNWQKSPKYLAGVKSQILSVKEDVFREYLLEKLDTLCIGYGYPLIEPITNTNLDTVDLYVDVNSESNSKSNKKKNKNSIHDNYSTERHRHGEYGHVLLTQKQYDKLVSEYGEENLKLAIKNVDEYCQQHGKSYSDYNLTIRKWGFDCIEGFKKPEKTKKREKMMKDAKDLIKQLEAEEAENEKK